MLILTRRVGETLMIGDDVTVTVLSMKGNQIRLGVNAPKETTVHREEIHQRIKEEKAVKEAKEAELIKGLYLFAFREIDTQKPLLWIATERSNLSGVEADAAILALFHSECHGYPLDEFYIELIWTPDMVFYHDTDLACEAENSIYAALVAECRITHQATPFVVPMPTSTQETLAVELEGAA